ncbi:MAG: universal stress protein [Bacteroidota bacterium]|jgi:nucleotide-binding universal stress UspA family protein
MPHPTNNILIPIDFSEQSFRAVKYAAVVAQSISVRLNFLYVFEVGETSPAFRTKQHQTAMNQVHKKFKSSIITLLENLGNINQELFIEQGKVYDRILEKAASLNAIMIIMGCNSADDFKNRFLGSNTLRIMRSSPVPVLASNHYSTLVKFKNIILPVDLSKDAKDKLNRSLAMAKFNPEIIIHIVSVVFDADEFLINRLGQQLVEVKRVIENSKVKHTAEIIKCALGYESLGEIISDYARKIDGDVIMLMTQQEISNTPYFVSSLAQEIINISEVPVMTIAPI